MSREGEAILQKFFWALIPAAILALVGWVYTIGNRVSAAEAHQEEMSNTLTEIRNDVRSIDEFLRGNHR